ncbi:MAG: IS200/IS605 family element transposase accessory protein TnpB [Candidatus Heimdallarchaeota archaeon]|nr:IS200/IS605 family element transposase accessory protein TnpB [Candidatus Heimdallarchaeota archaeon]
MKIEELNKQEELLIENNKHGKHGEVKSTTQIPLVTFYETVSLRIKTELMTIRECERLRRITERDTRIIRDYLRIIYHNEEKILRKNGKVSASLLDKLTLTTSKKTNHKLRTSVPHDLKKRYPRCSFDELQECRDKAIWTYESWKTQQNVSKNELSRPSFKKKTPRPLFKGTQGRGTFQVHHEPVNTDAKLWLELRDSLDTKRSSNRTHNRLWLPLAYSPYHEKRLKLENIKMMELVHKSKEQQWWAHFTLQYSIPQYQSILPPAVLGVDLGIKKTAVAVLLNPTGRVIMDEIRFIVDKERQSKIWQISRQIKETQRKLNKSLNNGQHTEQLNATLFSLRRRRRSVTEQELGYAVNQLVDFILQLKKRYNLFVSVGYPKNIRKRHRRGSGNKSLRKKVHKWCFRYFITRLQYQLTKYGFEPHRVVAVNESWTSKRCSRCNSLNTTRTGQGQFNCHQCNYELDADLNGAKNIGKRLIRYALKPKFSGIRDTLTEDYHPLRHYNCFQPLGQWLK